MKRKIKITILFLLFAQSAFAFTFASPDLFKPWYQKTWEKIVKCTWHISCYQEKLGSFTTISATDSQVDFPTTYNANLTKTLETGTTSVASITTLNNLTSASSLATVGTITSGTWTGSVIDVARQGTGSTSPMSNYVMLGAGANGFKTVNGLGSSGQFLISQGSSNPPIWSTSVIDLTANYSFTGTYVGIDNFSASSTAANPIKLNKLSYSLPDTRAASNTVLMENGSGALSWNPMEWYLLNSTTTTYATSSIPLTIAARQFLKVEIFVPSASAASNATSIAFNGDKGGTNYGALNYRNFASIGDGNQTLSNQATMSIDPLATTSPEFYSMQINNPLSTRKYVIWDATKQSTGAIWPVRDSGAGVWNNTSAQITTFELDRAGGETYGIGTIIRVYGSSN